MTKDLENRIVHQHVTYLKRLQRPLLEDIIPAYIQSLPMAEQQVLLRRAKKWLCRYWDKRTQSLKYPLYLASVGQCNKETLCAYLFLSNYACSNDFVAR